MSSLSNKMHYKDVFDMDFAHHNNNNNNDGEDGNSSGGSAASSGCNEVGSTSNSSSSHVVSASLAAGEIPLDTLVKAKKKSSLHSSPTTLSHPGSQFLRGQFMETQMFQDFMDSVTSFDSGSDSPPPHSQSSSSRPSSSASSQSLNYCHSTTSDEQLAAVRQGSSHI